MGQSQASLTEGGLQIRDPRLTNMALGGKLLWKLHSDSNHPVSKILRLKYMRGKSLHNLQEVNVQKGLSLGTYAGKAMISSNPDYIEFEVEEIRHSYGKTTSWGSPLLKSWKELTASGTG